MIIRPVVGGVIRPPARSTLSKGVSTFALILRNGTPLQLRDGSPYLLRAS